MSLHSHIVELQRRHKALERQIETSARAPGTSDLEMADLKRRKLLLKDEIARLTLPSTVH